MLGAGWQKRHTSTQSMTPTFPTGSVTAVTNTNPHRPMRMPRKAPPRPQGSVGASCYDYSKTYNSLSLMDDFRQACAPTPPTRAVITDFLLLIMF